MDGASRGDASAPPPPPSPPLPLLTRDRREREPRATSWRTRRLSRRSGRANGPRDLRRNCRRHREAQREARRRRALLLGRPSLPLVSTDARRAHGKHCVLPKRRFARRPRRTSIAVCGAKHVLRTRFVCDIHTLTLFSARESKPSITVWQSRLSPLNTFPLKALDAEAESATYSRLHTPMD